MPSTAPRPLHLIRADASEPIEGQPLQLGNRIRSLRLGLNLTLEETSQRTGLARSTLSKIENEQISPTFSAMNKLAQGLGIDLPQLFTPLQQPQPGAGRRDITRRDQGQKHPTPTYEHELLATALSRKKMIPYRTRVHARSFEAFGEWIRHDGEEFLYVLSGRVRFYTEFYEPTELGVGDSAYYDCHMGHALVSISDADAEVLWVTASGA